jgi:glycosyltransferase involved in cell wall biosynthesis
MTPTITIGVPCYNYGRYLSACLDALLTQESVVVDIVIVDDCSTDDTRKIAAGYQTRDPLRVRVVRNTVNQGYCETFNRCIDEARAPYFSIVSADDVLVPGALARAVTVMEDYPGIGLVYGPHCSIDKNGLQWAGMHRGQPPRPRTGTRWSAILFPGHEWNRRVCKSGKNAIIGSEAVVRTSVQKAAGYYDPLIPHAADAEMWLRVAALTDVAFIRGVDQMLYRYHHCSMQHTVFSGQGFDRQMRGRSFRSAFRKKAITATDLAAAEIAMSREVDRPYPDPNWFRREVLGRVYWHIRRHNGITNV